MDEQSQSQPINIVPMGPEHIETLARLEQACFSSPWSFDALAGELSDPLAVWMQGFGIEWLSVAAPVVAPVFITLVVSYLST